MKDIDHDDLMQTLETCGEAMGFALAAALRSPEDFNTNKGLSTFAGHLDSMIESERFSPDASLVLAGIARGLNAFALATPSGGEIL